jgi:hypothetical protein
MKYLQLFESFSNIFYHGSTDKMFLGKKGIHVGTYKAAKQALEARIGVPAEGEWDGTRQYDKTLLAGKKTLKRIQEQEGRYVKTGYNCGEDIPEEDYYPTEKKNLPQYSDKSYIDLKSHPIIFPVKIIGKMTNTINTPHTDITANSLMLRNLKLGNAKRGYYYINDGEDSGSISAVVPSGTFLQII